MGQTHEELHESDRLSILGGFYARILTMLRLGLILLDCILLQCILVVEYIFQSVLTDCVMFKFILINCVRYYV